MCCLLTPSSNILLGLEPFLRIPLCLTGVQLLFQVLARLLLSSFCAPPELLPGTHSPTSPTGMGPGQVHAPLELDLASPAEASQPALHPWMFGLGVRQGAS